MKMKELETVVREELKQENIAEKKELLKERIREIEGAEKVLATLKSELQVLFDQEV